MTSTEAATLLHVHPSTVKRWCNEGDLAFEATPGGHRRIPVEQAVGFARDRGIRTVLTPFRPFEPHVWTALSRARDEGSFGELHALALGWARRGDFDRLEQLYLALGHAGVVGFCDFCDGAVRGLMREVGDEWESGRLRVGDEHMVSQAVSAALGTLRREWLDARPGTGRRDRPLAVVGCMEGNQHHLGAMCVRLLLERLGWTVFFPGADVPIEDFAAIQRSREATLVCISLPPEGSAGYVARGLSVLGQFYDRARPYDLVFGGSGATSMPDLEGSSQPVRSVSLLGDCRSLREALEGGLGSPEGRS